MIATSIPSGPLGEYSRTLHHCSSYPSCHLLNSFLMKHLCLLPRSVKILARTRLLISDTHKDEPGPLFCTLTLEGRAKKVLHFTGTCCRHMHTGSENQDKVTGHSGDSVPDGDLFQMAAGISVWTWGGADDPLIGPADIQHCLCICTHSYGGCTLAHGEAFFDSFFHTSWA